MEDPTKYNMIGRQMTGFNSEIERSTFGHYTNPEYQMINNDDPVPLCKSCGDTGCVTSDFGAAICVDCCVGIPLEDAIVIIRDYPDCDSFVCEHYEFYSNGAGDNSQDLANYWQRCKEIINSLNQLPY